LCEPRPPIFRREAGNENSESGHGRDRLLLDDRVVVDELQPGDHERAPLNHPHMIMTDLAGIIHHAAVRPRVSELLDPLGVIQEHGVDQSSVMFGVDLGATDVHGVDADVGIS